MILFFNRIKENNCLIFVIRTYGSDSSLERKFENMGCSIHVLTIYSTRKKEKRNQPINRSNVLYWTLDGQESIGNKLDYLSSVGNTGKTIDYLYIRTEVQLYEWRALSDLFHHSQSGLMKRIKKISTSINICPNKVKRIQNSHSMTLNFNTWCKSFNWQVTIISCYLTLRMILSSISTIQFWMKIPIVHLSFLGLADSLGVGNAI